VYTLADGEIPATGIVGCHHAIEMSPEQWRKTLDVNTTGSFLSAQVSRSRWIVQPKNIG
jgi:NAD(P)-dependent dehydrogenase (short-subunit alcohol dehydrogenase family)